MAQSQIRWKQIDYLTLGKAVANYNKKIIRLQNEENKLYLPETINYQDVKNKITTRRELNRVINSLRRFLRKGAEDLYITQAGESITRWERNELSIQSRIAQNRLRRELTTLNEPDASGFSRIQMGSIRAREIEAQLNNLRTFENKTGYEFNRLRRRIMNVGTSDYEMRKAIVFRENYMQVMERYSNYDNFNLLMKKLNSIHNPVSFFEFVSQNEISGDLIYQSDQHYSQAQFNRFIENFGIQISENERLE